MTQEQRDTLYEALREVAIKYKHPRIVIGYFRGDTESQRFAMSLYLVFKDARWTMVNDLNLVQRPLQDRPAWGYTEGLSFTCPTKNPGVVATSKETNQISIFMAVDSAFHNAGMLLQMYPTGKGDPLPETDDLVFWVGLKKADWSEVHQPLAGSR